VSDEILVTGSLTAERRDRLPVAASVIDGEEIAARQATAVADLLRTVAGIDVVRSGSAGKATSVFTRGTESDHTLVLWNGIELNSPFFGGFDWSLLPSEGVERVEVVRGPFSALYGSDAVGGVVHVLTGTMDDRVSVESGEDGYRRLALTGGVEGERFHLDVAAHARRGDGLADNDFYDSDQLVATGGWRMGAGAEIGLVVRANDSDLGIPFAGGRATPNRVTTWREREVAVPLRVETGEWTVEARLSRVTFDNRLDDPDDPFGFTFAESASRSERARVVGSYRFDDDLWLAVGGEYEEQQVDSGSVFGRDLEDAGQTTRAVFGQLFYAVGALSFDLGVRQDEHDALGGTTNPRVGVAWQVTESQRLHAAFGEGFRSPSLGELYFPFSGNPALEPEESTSLELGYVLERDAWELTVTGFENELDNLIDFDFVEFKNVNVGRARTRGAEFGLERRWRRAALRGQASWLEAEDLDSGLALLRRADWRGSLVGTVGMDDWSLSATVLYTGRRDDVDPITFERSVNPAYERLDLAARYRGWERFSPYARVENVTDEEYAEALGFPAPGRRLVGGVSLDF
jgi:vitamin B12 transporter